MNVSPSSGSSSLHRKVVVITGATRGIGYAMLTHLQALGATVYGCGRSIVDEQAIASVDIRSQTQVREWRNRIQVEQEGVDLLINNAGVLGRRGSFSSVDDETWRQVLDVNVLGTIRVTREFMPLLRPKRAEDVQTTIINIGSVLGVFGRAGWSTYAVSKFALQGLTQVLAQELSRERIRVVSLHPPRISTALRRDAYPDEKEVDEGMRDVIAAVAKIAADPCSLISGLTLSASDVLYWA